MKTSSVLASVLFGAIAAAAPFDKRALVTRTQVLTETVLVFTTVYADEVPIAPATTTPGLFFEQPASSKAAPSSTAVYTPPVVAAPSSAAPQPSPPAPSSVYTPPVVAVPSSTVVVPVPEPTFFNSPAPVPSPTAVPPPPPPPASSAAPPASSAAPVPAPQPSVAPPTGNPTGKIYHGDITVYDNPKGALGACGEEQNDKSMIVALAAGLMGPSTYDVMTGAATNAWCGQWITVEYNGKQAKARITDKCPGCNGAEDIDLGRGVWEALGITEDTRLQASWWKSSA